METTGSIRSDLGAKLDGAFGAVTRAQLRLLEVIVECDRAEVWRGDGFGDLASWLAARLGTSVWAARRWINAAYALPHLPRVREAFLQGVLSLEKTIELCRFATPGSERKLVAWARRVRPAAIRRRADLALRAEIADAQDADRARHLRIWWFDDDRRLGIDGSLPAAEGAVVAAALDRLAERVPDIVDDDGTADPEIEMPYGSLEARRADALVALCSGAISADPDPDRATVVVHTDLDALLSADRPAEIENAAIIHPETARRLACDGRLEFVGYGDGRPLGVGRASRNVPAWLRRLLRRRDGGCTFPNCPQRRYLYAHHIVHWLWGGPTDLDNLVLVCGFHHKLVHEHGWTVMLDPPHGAQWFRPNGRRYEAVAADRASPELAIA